MSLPPERINIKRRRQDDPIEALLLEQAPGRDRKRRATDFVFKRLRADEVNDVPRPPGLVQKAPSERSEKQRSASQSDNSGIPLIRTTLPGDEVNDLKALKAAIKSRVDSEHSQDASNAPKQVSTETAVRSRTTMIKIPTDARRFYLSREQDHLGPSKLHAGIRKSVHRSKTNLATFIERGFSRMAQHNQADSKGLPIDRMVEVTRFNARKTRDSDTGESDQVQTQVITKHTFDHSFVKPSMDDVKTGQSIHTHPSTWDFDSDQLASELAAFAFELDPTSETESAVVASKPVSIVEDTKLEEDYIYETYIRLPHNADVQAVIEENNLTANIGVLIVAEEDEELWEAYAESDSEDEWDEEDADSNAEDNPANDYPEDEVSTDDEYGIGSYDHRRNASDEEEFDLERDD